MNDENAQPQVRKEQVWFCEPAHDRPSSICPKCKQQAMQFYHECKHVKDRTDFYLCCACGTTWDM